MTLITWLMLIAALLPLFAAAASKAGGKGFDNHTPRTWLAGQQGWRARANAAQQNLFESLPFFYGATLFALYNHAQPGQLTALMGAWLLLRIAYFVAYVADYASIRSLIWVVTFVVNIGILVSGN
jgi:uncharacterized MAPEG superfamily protein